MRWINYSESKSYIKVVQSHWPCQKFKVKLGLHAQEFIQVFALLLEDSSNVYLHINSQLKRLKLNVATTADLAWLTAENVYLTSSELSWSQNNNNIEYCCQMPQFNNSEEGTIAIARWWLKSNFSWTKKIWTILKYDLCSELCIFSYLNWLWQRNVEKNDLIFNINDKSTKISRHRNVCSLRCW